MVSGSELEIVGLYNKDISGIYSINQIASKLGKSYPYIYDRVQHLLEEGVLKKIVVGRSHLCSIDLKDDKAVALLMLNEIDKKRKERRIKSLADDIANIVSRFDIHTIFMVDGQVYVVLDHKHDAEAIKNFYPASRSFEFLAPAEFQDLVDRLKKVTVVYSFERYFELLRPMHESMLLKHLSS